MKDYEKLAIAIGGGALAIAAYSAYKAKEAADATAATDPSRNPVSAAIDLGTSVVGNTYDWFRQRYDNATGRITGKSNDVIDSIKAIPSQVGYHIMKPIDYGRKATEAGTKYLWGLGGRLASKGKEQYDILTNKPFTAMGSAPIYIYEAARKVPISASALANVLTGVGSKLEATKITMKSKAEQIKEGVSGVFHSLGFKPWVRGHR